jgi:hypothetical protein
MSEENSYQWLKDCIIRYVKYLETEYGLKSGGKYFDLIEYCYDSNPDNPDFKTGMDLLKIYRKVLNNT